MGTDANADASYDGDGATGGVATRGGPAVYPSKGYLSESLCLPRWLLAGYYPFDATAVLV